MINDWDIQTIANWNKYRFPDNGIIRQRRKVEEEIGEFERASSKENKMEELADVYIAFAGYSRFSTIGKFVCRLFEQIPEFETILQPAINAKMKINNTRIFDKQMHHVDVPLADNTEDAVKPYGFVPEYVTVQKDFNVWKKDENGEDWHKEPQKDEFLALKDEYYKWDEKNE
ncbi:MAG: hypothetical protein SPL72_04110 [Cyanobacteriota bacterium]|nr:hypothetical protein [Cyanobacteriota bacterium]